jgi:hypothetical protein
MRGREAMFRERKGRRRLPGRCDGENRAKKEGGEHHNVLGGESSRNDSNNGGKAAAVENWGRQLEGLRTSFLWGQGSSTSITAGSELLTVRRLLLPGTAWGE